MNEENEKNFDLKNSLDELVGKTIIAKITGKERSKIVLGEVVKGKIDVAYDVDPSRNSIGKRERKDIELRGGENIYFVKRDDSGKIISHYELYPVMSSKFLGVGVYSND